MDAPGFGASYKDAVRKGQWNINISAFCECLSRKENYVEIDRDRVDAWGVPVLKMHCEYGDNEVEAMEDSREQGAEMLEAAGATNVHLTGNAVGVRVLHP